MFFIEYPKLSLSIFCSFSQLTEVFIRQKVLNLIGASGYVGGDLPNSCVQCSIVVVGDN